MDFSNIVRMFFTMLGKEPSRSIESSSVQVLVIIVSLFICGLVASIILQVLEFITAKFFTFKTFTVDGVLFLECFLIVMFTFSGLALLSFPLTWGAT